jgi:CheY-like chemotaxis protein
MTAKTILLIHKDPNQREIIFECLTDLAGWNVQVADSTLEGLQQIQFDRIDAIIFEFSLSEISELLFLKQLRLQPATEGIPVVLLSLRHKWFDLDFLQQYQAVTVTFNPLDLATLPLRIAHVLGWDL